MSGQFIQQPAILETHDSVSLCSSSPVGSGSTDKPKKFCLPDTWRPAIMCAIEADGDADKRKKLTPDIRNAIVRDLVSTMYAHMSQPNKEFCTQVAKQLVEKYSFMRDRGQNVTGYVSILLIFTIIRIFHFTL